MRIIPENQACKRPVNLTLNEDLVAQPKGVSNNLSALAESLPADYVAKQNEARHADNTAEAWNNFNERAGFFADEHSTL